MKGFVLGLASCFALAAPAFAQFGAPLGGGYGSPGLYTAPEAAAGAIGGGAANTAATQAQCAQSAGGGRDRGRTVCAPVSPDPARR